MMGKKSIQKKVATSIKLSEPIRRRLDAFCEAHYNAELSTVIEKAVIKFLDEEERPDDI